MPLRPTQIPLTFGSLLGSMLLLLLPVIGDHPLGASSAQSESQPEDSAPDPQPEDPATEQLLAGEEAAIQAVIRQQLEAFQQEDAETAFSFASPDIQDQFGSADRFAAMVRSSYAPVYNAATAEFLELTVIRGTPAQQVRLVGADGNSILALYLMEQQQDDSWRISACLLQPSRQPAGIGA